ncbi:MAG: DnaD domain protein [Chloroflexi bacterium]|nr:DnaD domain protein [Chloroflexota bacterium]
MKPFHGFPHRMEFTPIPSVFFSHLLPRIDSLAELKTTLAMLAAWYRKKGYPRFVSQGELLADRALADSIAAAGTPPEDILTAALKLVTERGVFLRLVLDDNDNGRPETLYFLNTASSREVMAKIARGELEIRGLRPAGKPCEAPETAPDIFETYEDNIGALTPLIADELRQAEKLYPEHWLRDAIREAAAANKRKWSYISAILERWSVEGKEDGAHKRGPETGPDKYARQKYGNMVRR